MKTPLNQMIVSVLSVSAVAIAVETEGSKDSYADERKHKEKLCACGLNKVFEINDANETHVIIVTVAVQDEFLVEKVVCVSSFSHRTILRGALFDFVY